MDGGAWSRGAGTNTKPVENDKGLEEVDGHGHLRRERSRHIKRKVYCFAILSIYPLEVWRNILELIAAHRPDQIV